MRKRVLENTTINNNGEGNGNDIIPLLPLHQTVSSVFNNIYFYGDVEISSALALNKELKKMATDLLHTNISYGLESHINLFICTDGGDIFAALSIVDAIQRSPVPVHTIVDGFSASAGTIMSIHGHKRYITENSYMLIHQLSSYTFGTYENIKDDMHNSDKLMLQLKNMYKKKSKMTTKQITEILKHDLYLSSHEALELGLVDGIYNG